MGDCLEGDTKTTRFTKTRTLAHTAWEHQLWAPVSSSSAGSGAASSSGPGLGPAATPHRSATGLRVSQVNEV